MNTDFHSELSAALEHVKDSPWDSPRIAKGLSGIKRKKRNRALASSGITLAAAALIFGLSTKMAQHLELQPVATQTSPSPSPVNLADGSQIIPLAETTRVQLRHASEELIVVELEAGSAHFEVSPNHQRRFVVHSAEVKVEVLGTAFQVTRSADHSSVDVERGLVRVTHQGKETLLRAGDAAAFPDESIGVGSTDDSVDTNAADSRHLSRQNLRTPRSSTPNPSIESPRRPSSSPQIAGGPGSDEAPFASTALPSNRTAAELWAAADQAREERRYGDAIPYLVELSTRVPDSQGAQNALFTLGRLYLDTGDASRAASAFAKAQRMGGQLAEHALYREIQALIAGGDLSQAERRTAKYLQRYPEGRYREELQARSP